jgi:hypothetical protein
MMGAGCQPDFGTPSSLVTGERILAIAGAPAEVRPGQSVTLTPLVVSPAGTESAPAIDWALCMTPKPLDENNVVASACLGDQGVQRSGVGAVQTVVVPVTACQLFGPDPPPQMPGLPPLRPRDPDVSGGYYQPVRASVEAQVGFALERITCNLASAGADTAVMFAMEYQPNQNPSLLRNPDRTLPLMPISGGAPIDLGAVPLGATVTFTVGWPPESVETYPIYDVASQEIVQHRESMRVSWFATAGSFSHEHTGRTEDETDTFTTNDWTAPAQSGVVHFWVVLRDSRGGTDFEGFDAIVGP